MLWPTPICTTTLARRALWITTGPAAVAAARAPTAAPADPPASFEPFQVYNSVGVEEMAWTSTVGDLWRSGT